MKKLLLPALLAATLYAFAQEPAQEPEQDPADEPAQNNVQKFSVNPIKYTFYLPDDEGDDYFSFYKTPGTEITYAIMGENIVDVDEDSLDLRIATDENGNDLLEYVNNAQKQNNNFIRQFFNHNAKNHGPYCQTTSPGANGKRATFSVYIATERPMVLANFTGSIHVWSAKQTETETLTFKNEDKDVEQTAGPLIFSIKDVENNKRDFYGDFTLEMEGNRKHIKGIKLLGDGKELRNTITAYGGREGKVNYYYPNTPKAHEFTLEVTYHADLQKTRVHFGKQPQPEDGNW